MHDKCTYYANSDQSYFWGNDHTNVLQQKSLGASIMVSDFIDEVRGYIRDDQDQAHLLLETHREGYFTNDHLLLQVARTINVFERVHPDAKALFLFDNTPSHRKVADERVTIKTFNGQKTILEDYIEQRGHICIFYPKFHCELSPIERVWCQSKKHTRAYADGTITRLRKIVPEGLDSVTIEQMKKFFRNYENAYREGGTGREVEEHVKIYKSHRRVYDYNTLSFFGCVYIHYINYVPWPCLFYT